MTLANVSGGLDPVRLMMRFTSDGSASESPDEGLTDIFAGALIITTVTGIGVGGSIEYSADSITFLVNVERPASQGSYTHPDDLISKRFCCS